MSSIDDPLTKAAWPEVDSSIQEAVLNQLITLKSSGTASSVLVGFNPVMAALEQQFRGGGPGVQTLFVARHDISALESMPLSLASAAGKIRLVTLQKGSKDRLDGVSVVGVTASDANTALLEKLVENVGHAETSWTYVGARASKQNKNPNKIQQHDKKK